MLSRGCSVCADTLLAPPCGLASLCPSLVCSCLRPGRWMGNGTGRAGLEERPGLRQATVLVLLLSTGPRPKGAGVGKRQWIWGGVLLREQSEVGQGLISVLIPGLCHLVWMKTSRNRCEASCEIRSGRHGMSFCTEGRESSPFTDPLLFQRFNISIVGSVTNSNAMVCL